MSGLVSRAKYRRARRCIEHLEHIRSPSDMVTSEADVPSDDGAQAGAGAPAEETASDDIDCRRAASSEGGAGMDDGARVREGEDDAEDHATKKKRKKRDAGAFLHEVRISSRTPVPKFSSETMPKSDLSLGRA